MHCATGGMATLPRSPPRHTCAHSRPSPPNTATHMCAQPPFPSQHRHTHVRTQTPLAHPPTVSLRHGACRACAPAPCRCLASMSPPHLSTPHAAAPAAPAPRPAARRELSRRWETTAWMGKLLHGWANHCMDGQTTAWVGKPLHGWASK
eukprot:354157-Chlamydomonas_euryale.AAC.11